MAVFSFRFVVVVVFAHRFCSSIRFIISLSFRILFPASPLFVHRFTSSARRLVCAVTFWCVALRECFSGLQYENGAIIRLVAICTRCKCFCLLLFFSSFRVYHTSEMFRLMVCIRIEDVGGFIRLCSFNTLVC